MAQSDWLADLARLRAGAGDSATYRSRWWPVKSVPLGLPPAFLAFRVARRGADLDRFDVALYRSDSPAGALPLAIVPVSASAEVPRLSQGQLVSARGEVRPGAAVIIEVEDHDLQPVGPCWVPTIRRRRYRL